jgi:LemA protein
VKNASDPLTRPGAFFFEDVFIHNDNNMALLIFSTILAVLFFWAVGAYNRLVVLRASVAKQFAAVDAQLIRVLVWLQGNLPASMRDMLSEMEEAALPEALLKNERDLKLLAILEELSDSLDLARTQPLTPVVMSQVNQNRLALAAWAKAEVRAGQSGEATWFIDPLPYKFDRLKAQAWPLMDAYNQAALKYNDAVSQFPASVLAKQLNFVPAQTLDITDLLA